MRVLAIIDAIKPPGDRRRGIIWRGLAMTVAALVLALFAIVHPRGPGAVSSCSGTPANGSLRDAVSIPHMLSVLRDGAPVPFPASPFDGFGNAVEFDRHGRHGDYRIDYEAMVASCSRRCASRARRRGSVTTNH